jgi:glutamyl-tRNA reductase
MTQVDLVVACSGQRTGMLDKTLMEATVARRKRPLPIVDLALHAHVADAARHVPGVRVIDLRSVQDSAGAERLETIMAGEQIVSSAVTAFEERMAIREVDPAITALRQHVTTTVDKEIERLRTRYPPDVIRDVEHAVHRISQALLHIPTVRAQELARSGHAAAYIQALRTLFGLDIHESKLLALASVLRTG